MTLKTRLTELLGLQYPIVSAPMAGHSGGALAAAVTKAGGLGTFGGVSPGGADWVREQARFVREQTRGLFGVGFITAFIPGMMANFEACLEERVPFIIFSFGDPTPYMAKVKAAGLKTMCQVQTLEGARLALDGGADILVAQGNEAGGHSGYLNSLPCLSLVLEIAGDTPVLAAGGIANGRSLAAVLAAGAEGAVVGTALLATPEAVEVPDRFKELIVASDGQDTVHTRLYDILGGAPWPEGIGGRVHKNRLVEEWLGREADLPAKRDEVRAAIGEGERRRDPDVSAVWMGQSAGFVHAVLPAAEVVRRICKDAERILRERTARLLA
jgi:nitronate monooxygenase